MSETPRCCWYQSPGAIGHLDKMAGQLQAAGIEVKIDPQSYPNGRFARVHDPEGNPIELWQPKVSDTKS